MFDTELLKSFVAVAESGGFTRAAARLNSTQSTVSAQIQRLESGAGHPLFARSTRSVNLTPEGEVLLGYARTILRLNEDARLHLSGKRRGGRLRVGAGEDLVGWLPKILKAFSRQYPDVRIEVEIGIGMDLLRMMETRTLDLAIGGVCVDQVGGRSLFKEPLVWAFAPETAVPDPLPLAFFPEPCPYREAALRALASTQRDWHIACTSSSLAGVRAIAMAGIAVTPLPVHAMTPGLRALGPKTRLPTLPKVDFVLELNQSETREAVLAFADCCERGFTAEGRQAKARRNSRGPQQTRRQEEPPGHGARNSGSGVLLAARCSKLSK
jgi:DNA-binding transcriptional LysR family regulator